MTGSDIWVVVPLQDVFGRPVYRIGYEPSASMRSAWSDRYMTLDDWRRDWNDGHYAIVIGLNKDVLLFEDPATIRRTWLREREFLARWHDVDTKTGEKYEHFCIVLLGKQPAKLSLEHMD